MFITPTTLRKIIFKLPTCPIWTSTPSTTNRSRKQSHPVHTVFRSFERFWNDRKCAKSVPIIHTRWSHPKKEDVCRNIGFEASEIAAIIPEVEGRVTRQHDIVIFRRGKHNENGYKRFVTFQATHRSYNLVAYESLFSNETDGWHPGLNHSNNSSQRKRPPRTSLLGWFSTHINSSKVRMTLEIYSEPFAFFSNML